MKTGEENVTINLRHIMIFPDDKFNIRVVNTDEVIHDMESLVKIAGRFV